jgi:hypothetical protein
MTKTGPKSIRGKINSSGNSTDHGLRSNKLTTVDQEESYQQYLKELIDYYRPQGPIERLELERITICKVKLESLYELERAKTKLLLSQFKIDEQKEISSLKTLKPLVMGMLKELFLFKKIALPCNFKYDELSAIVNEVISFNGDIESDDDLRDFFPRLSSFLEQYEPSERLHKNLTAVFEKFDNAIKSGADYAITAEAYNKSLKTDNHASPDEVKADPAMDELDEYIAMRNAERNKNFRVKINPNILSFPSKSEISKGFNCFNLILSAYHEALFREEIIRSHLALKKAALSLPQEESDLLMRYQTSWERRLSTAIGELMELIKMRPKESPVARITKR